MNLRKLAIILFSALPAFGFAQGSEFSYKRKINPVDKEGWYSIPLPAEQYVHTAHNFNDLRLYAIEGKDTSEIPFLLDIKTTQVERSDIYLTSINKSKKDGKLFVTFELPKGQQVNHIDLAFEQNNFFAFVKIEGSEDQKEWFEIADQARIFSIRNNAEDFRSGVVNFPVSEYRYLRVSVKSDTPLTFSNASFQNLEVKAGTFQKVPVIWKTEQDKKSKQTIVHVKLDHYQPVSKVALDINKENDFYRSITIRYLTDSTKTDKGWVRYFETIQDDYISSFQNNSFDLGFYLTNELEIIVHNYDNAPVTIKDVIVSGATVELKAQLKPQDNFLFYGNKTLDRPSYDLDYFMEKIPKEVPSIAVGPEESLVAPATPVSALFENKIWLWVIMILVIAILGFFTLRMMSSKQTTA